MGRVCDSDGRGDPLGVYVQWELACLLDVENGDMVYTPKRVGVAGKYSSSGVLYFFTHLISYYLGIMNINMKHASKEHLRM